MAWQDEMTPTLRVMVNDYDEENYAFSDDSIEQLLIVAAKQVATEMSFTQTFVVSVANATISPDPTATATRDNNYVNLVTIKAACLIDRGATRKMVQQGLYVKDGDSIVDLRALPANQIRLLEKGWCAVYDNEKFAYASASLGGTVGAIILGPFRLFADSLGNGSGFSGLSSTYDPRNRNLNF